MKAEASTTNMVSPKETSPSHGSRHNGTTTTMHKLWKTIRIFLCDVPLALTFGTLLTVYALRNIYYDLYLPLMDRATRTDEDLDREFTYYHRYCTQADLTTRNIHDLVANPQAPARQAVAQMMEHGAIVIRNLLQPETVRKLREYAVYRNHHIPDEEVYPVSQGKNRMSFGYDATESPAVVQALQELSNNAFLKQVLSGILGDEDPASSEITTITAYYGAPPQAWHSDTKEDGNALKFARTYSHSYSLFLPLQNTTKKMGMTDVCPGTHYCGNDLSEMCEETKISLGEAAGPHFQAGDGALLNQIVWHRGAEHRDPHGLERIVMIVSFLARPNMQTDPRQLSRGTYFHQKWNMWGHTWKDLMDPMLSMQKPFSYLRCLSLWKPPHHSWGYDLITSGFMRFSNEQLDDEAIRARLWPRLDQIHFPEWLRSDLPNEYVMSQKESWKFFLEGTFERTLSFLRQVFWKSHVLYLAACALVAVGYHWSARHNKHATMVAIVNPLRRLLAYHSAAFVLVFYVWYHVRSSPWGVAVLKGKALMRPFPQIPILTDEELAFVSSGPTTFPANNDVMFGTRYDAKFLGQYEKYLDWHKGNKPYLRAIRGYAPLYPTYQRLPADFDRQLVQGVVESVTQTNGRFLEQDYRTGAWKILSDEETEARVRRDLAYAASPAKKALRQVLRRMIALGRFGFGRETMLARNGVVYLLMLEHRLAEITQPPAAKPESFAVEWTIGPRVWSSLPTTRETSRRVPAHSRGPYVSALDNKHVEPFPVGSTVYLQEKIPDEELEWYRGQVMEISEMGKFLTIALESGHTRKVPRNKVHKYEPMTEGDRLEGCFGEYFFEDCYEGTAMYVAPDGSVDVMFDDGEFLRHPAHLLYKPPFKYIPPER